LKTICIIFTAVVLTGGLTGCNKGTTVSATEKRETPSPARNPLEISLTPQLEKQVKVAAPQVAPVAESLTVAARVAADRRRIANIHSPVSGRITDLRVFAGEQVRKGQVLGTLYGTGLTDIQLSLLKAHSQLQLAQRAVERANQLVAAGVIGSAEVQRRQAEVVQATAEITVLRDQLKVLGMGEEAIAKVESTRTVNSLTEIIAEIDGTVLERRASVGQIVQPTDILYEIADLSSVWVVADVPEQEAGDIQVGEIVETEIAAFPGALIRGRVSFVSPTVSPETRTIQVRIDLPNPQRKYKPAMLAEMTLRGPAQQRKVVPLAAVVREDNHEYLFVQTGEKSFTLREVMLGKEFDQVRVLLDGVNPGEKIVTDGAFHLNNERKRLALTGGVGDR
jgi:cobalt-zinc-cadmium efflux system membrane fusion protein